RLLSEGISAIGEVPAGRWTDDRLTQSGTDDRSTPPGTDDRSTPPAIRHGGFIDDVDRFDPAFFGISPREAAAMDPQQRLMLELAWEGLEDAGIVPATLRGATVGAFIGAGSDDYASLIRAHGRSHHTLTGTQRGMIANRLSHVFGLSGPSVTVDAAQASSLVAVHMAVESVRRGESRLALAGGVNLNLSAETAADIAAFGALSPDGRCFTFDARANGYVRGEGGGLVVLKPLSDALADGDTVYCVIEGSAVNNDGGGASLTAPDPDGQRQVLRLAQRRAAISPEAVQYVELHGTGTALGDPAEAAALGAVFGRSGARPVQLGSVKTNIGHLEAAAGIAGLLKTALAIHHRQLPAGLNYRTPNPRIPMGELNLEMRLAPGEWPRPDDRLVAGVSSFGMGGTNCHVLLAEPLVGALSHASAQRPEPESVPSPIPAPAPTSIPAPAPAPLPLPLPLSGVSAAALRGQAARLRPYLERSPNLTDLSYSLATTRTSFDHRAVLITGQATDAAHGLDALAEGGTVAGLVTGTARAAGKLAFAFAGQGSQRLGMGRELSAVFPVFAQALDDVCTALDAHLDRPLRDVIHGDDAELLNRTVYAQAGLFAVEVALFRLLEDFGLVPDLLIGHSLGEVSAAHVAGVLSLADAAAFVAARGRLMQAVTEPGAMVSLEATEDEVTGTLMAGGASDDGARVCVAAVNGPTATVISGDERAVLDLAAEWTRRGRRTKRLRTSHAFHSPHLDPVLDELRHIAESLTYRAPRIPLVSNVTGRRATAEALCSPEYWVRHVRRTVRFLDGVRCLEDEGVTTIVELGPDKGLTALARDCLTGPGTLVGTLRRDRSEPQALVTALAELYVSGVDVAWSRLISGGRRIPLPTYAFQRQRYWFSAPGPERTDTGLGGGEARDTGLSRDEASATGLSGGEMLGMVRAHAAVVLGYASATAIDAEHTFKQLGFDSITAVELCERLGAATALPLPGTLLFDYPTPTALAEHLHGRLHGRKDERAVPATVPTPDGGDPVVIVGMGCRFPGRAHSPEDLWRIVADGEDAISGFPSDRGWDLDGLYHPDPDRPGTSYARDGGFLYDAAEFDAGFFGISPREAEAMDPQQRLLLETSWEALERAGIPAEHIKGSSTGVFIGASSVGYAADAGEAAEGYQLTGTAASVASGRVSYTLGLEGPAVTVDTACSSSLVALHLAVQSLRAGECSLALAGGVTVMATPAMFVGPTTTGCGFSSWWPIVPS
ncbi:type I polyketide synthase, partial [Streptomyces asiaticus]